MLIRAYSDLHGFLPHIEECDALLIAGDICPIHGRYGDHTPTTQTRWLKEVFNPWLETQPVEQVVLIGGNHDAILDSNDGRGFHYELSPKANYLQDTGIRLPGGGPSIYGHPWIPRLGLWSFYKPDYRLRALAADLPSDYDIWMLHAPPENDEPGYSLDVTADGKHAGNPFVTPIIAERGPQLVVCGHVHQGFGDAWIEKTQVANVSFIDEQNRVRWRHLDIVWSEARRAIVTTFLARDNAMNGLWN